MAKFNVGDHVRVITGRHANDQFHCVGYITHIIEIDSFGRDLPLAVTLQDRRGLLYHEDDLELMVSQGLVDPEFDLDEIHQAEDLVNQRG